MQVINQTRNLPLMTQGRLANTFWQRFWGLMGVKSLAHNEGLILVGDKSIHTFFMKFPIDIVYVDKKFNVLRADSCMPPNRIGPFISQAAYILEMPSDVISTTHTQPGDVLVFAD
jgi:uncharacterized membrane protein (UPF0127 family)